MRHLHASRLPTTSEPAGREPSHSIAYRASSGHAAVPRRRVELRRGGAHGGQARPGHAWKVVVLVVVADVEADGVEAPVVRVRVDARAPHRVLGLKVRGDGVQLAREQRRER